MTEELSKAVWSGSFMLGDIEMKCHVLDNGMRIIEAESLEKLFPTQSKEKITQAQIIDFSKWKNGEGS